MHGHAAREKIKLLQIRLLTAKRETLHAGNRNVVKEIRVTRVEEEEEE